MKQALVYWFVASFWFSMGNGQTQIATDITFFSQATIPSFAASPAFIDYDYNAYFFGGVGTSGAFYSDIAGDGAIIVLPSMPQQRSGACAVVDKNGNFYIIGGDANQGSGTTSLYKYPSGSDTYSTLTSMSTPTQFARCAYDSTNDRIYVVGGVLTSPSTVLQTVSIYDIANDQWTTGTSTPVARGYFQLGLTSKGLFMLGGYDSNDLNTMTVYKYDIAGDAWSFVSGMNSEQSNAGTVVVEDKIIMLSGTGGCQYYDTNDNTATPIACNGLPDAAGGATFAALLGPNLYVIMSDGNVYRANCAVDNCLYGCVGGNCQPPSPTAPTAGPGAEPVATTPPVSVTPVTAAPFSECSGCQSPTPYCVPSRQICVGNRVVPILQCVDDDGGVVRAYFSYDNPHNTSFTLSSGLTTHYLLPSGTPNQLFSAGRPYFYPLASFTADYAENVIVEWFVDGYLLQFNTSTAPLCPVNITFAVFVSPPQDFATFWANLQATLARVMNVAPSQLTGRLVSNKRDLVDELEVALSPSDVPSDPSPADVVANFIGNTTTIEAVKSEVPEVQEIIGKKLPVELEGQAVPSNLNQAPSSSSGPASSVPVKVSSAVLSASTITSLLIVSLFIQAC